MTDMTGTWMKLPRKRNAELADDAETAEKVRAMALRAVECAARGQPRSGLVTEGQTAQVLQLVFAARGHRVDSQ